MLMERAGSGSNWLGKDFFQETVLEGGFRKAGTSPHGSKAATLKHAVGRKCVRNSRGVHSGGTATTQRFAFPEIQQVSQTPLLMLGKAPRLGVWL